MVFPFVISLQTAHSTHILQSKIFILHTLTDARLQCLPPILTTPLTQKVYRLRLISIHGEILRLRPILNELPLRAKSTDRSKEVIPVGSMAPGMKSCVVYRRVQDGSYMQGCDVSYIREEACNILVRQRG